MKQIILLFLLCQLFAYSCKKAASDQDDATPPSTEIPALTGSAKFGKYGNAGALHAQFFYPNTLFTDNVALRFSVDVTEIGTWFVSSDTVNGVWFKGTGSFHHTGITYVEVIGFGVPQKAGLFLFKTVLGKDSMGFRLDVSPGNAPSPTLPLSNRLPIANAGCDRLVSSVTTSVLLQGSAIDGDGTVKSLLWKQIAGPSVSIVNPTSASTNVNGLSQGTYQFELNTTDNQGGSKKDTVQVKVQPPGAAIYDLHHQQVGMCAGEIQNGVFVVGSPASQASYMFVLLQVRTPGTWSLSTKTVNGLTFSGSGTIATAGLTVVKLYGQGVPLAAGQFMYPLVEFPQCKIRIFAEQTLPTANAAYYYKATINGVLEEAYVIAGSGYMAGSGKGEFNNSANFSADISPEPNLPLPQSTLLEITKGLVTNYSTLTTSQFRSFFGQGSYSYAPGPDTNPVTLGNGISIIWKDKTGQLWSTSYGSRDQTGSTFQIISVVDEPDQFGTLYLRVKAKFQCKLYNTGGQVKQLTDGEFSGLFGKL